MHEHKSYATLDKNSSTDISEWVDSCVNARAFDALQQALPKSADDCPLFTQWLVDGLLTVAATPREKREAVEDGLIEMRLLVHSNPLQALHIFDRFAQFAETNPNHRQAIAEATLDILPHVTFRQALHTTRQLEKGDMLTAVSPAGFTLYTTSVNSIAVSAEHRGKIGIAYLQDDQNVVFAIEPVDPTKILDGFKGSVAELLNHIGRGPRFEDAACLQDFRDFAYQASTRLWRDNLMLRQATRADRIERPNSAFLQIAAE